MQLFRGYVPTKDKQCLEKFKGRKRLNTLSEVADLDEYAGILGDETILVDVDDGPTSDLLFQMVQDLGLKCKVYATTRGKHFYFRNPEGLVEKSWAKQTLAVGITTDAKVGRNNSYAILKFKGVERPVLLDCPEDEIQELPKWLMPVKTNIDFLELGEGDGRNQSLFNYILTLQSEDFTKEEARECIRLINRYVLAEPLSDRELEVILRDDAFRKTTFFKGNTFLFDKFANYLKNNNHITFSCWLNLKCLAHGMEPTVQNRIISFSMIIIKLEIPVLPIIIPPCPRRCGGGFVPLITTTALVSVMSLRAVASATTFAPTTRRVCGPAFPSNPPQSNPVPIPPPQGGGQSAQTKNRPDRAGTIGRVSARRNFYFCPFSKLLSLDRL